MLIVCPNCTSSYEVQPEKLGSAGRSVRCARCAKTWFANPATALAASSQAVASNAPSAPAQDSEPPPEGGDFKWTFDPADEIAEGGDAPAAGNALVPWDAAAAEAETSPSQDPASGSTGLITISDAPSLAPPLDGDLGPSPGPETYAAAENIETLAARRAKRVVKRKRAPWRPSLTLVVVGMAVVLGGLLAWRKQVVQFVPQTASLYEAIGLPVNLRGLVFDGVKISRETADGVTVLVVEGSIANVTARTVEVPRLRFGVRNVAGLEVYAWTAIPARTVLPPGDSVEFRSRLASPPADARDVVVRFFNRRDIVSAGR